MTERLKVIFSKPQDEWTEDDKTEVKKAIEDFRQEVDEVCRRHEMAYQAVLKFTPNGIEPVLNVVKLAKEDEEK